MRHSVHPPEAGIEDRKTRLASDTHAVTANPMHVRSVIAHKLRSSSSNFRPGAGSDLLRTVALHLDRLHKYRRKSK
jgi:hypothetical protein